MLQVTEISFPEYKSQEDMLTKIADFFKEGAAKCQNDFENPDDDWMPMYLIVLPDNKAQLVTSTLDKHILVNLIAGVAKEFGAVGIGQLNSSWRRMTSEPPKAGESIAGKPGSEEGLMLNVYSRTNWWVEWSAIKRDGEHPPTLEAWEVIMRRSADEEVRGPMFDPLLQALRKN